MSGEDSENIGGSECQKHVDELKSTLTEVAALLETLSDSLALEFRGILKKAFPAAIYVGMDLSELNADESKQSADVLLKQVNELLEQMIH